MVPAQMAALAVAALFLYAASFKVLDRAALLDTFSALGVTPGWAAVMSKALPYAEILVALAVVGPFPAAVGAALTACAAAGIAVAGLLALRRDEAIPCSCFSAYSSSSLGLRQVIVAAALLATIPVLLLRRVAGDLEESLLLLGGACAVAVVVHCGRSYRVLAESVGYRRALSSEFPA